MSEQKIPDIFCHFGVCCRRFFIRPQLPSCLDNSSLVVWLFANFIAGCLGILQLLVLLLLGNIAKTGLAACGLDQLIERFLAGLFQLVWMSAPALIANIHLAVRDGRKMSQVSEEFEEVLMRLHPHGESHGAITEIDFCHVKLAKDIKRLFLLKMRLVEKDGHRSCKAFVSSWLTSFIGF